MPRPTRESKGYSDVYFIDYLKIPAIITAQTYCAFTVQITHISLVWIRSTHAHTHTRTHARTHAQAAPPAKIGMEKRGKCEVGEFVLADTKLLFFTGVFCFFVCHCFAAMICVCVQVECVGLRARVCVCVRARARANVISFTLILCFALLCCVVSCCVLFALFSFAR